MNYAWIGTYVAIIVSGWLIARAIETLGNRIARPLNGPAAEDSLAISQVAAVLIGSALNNPVYISRMKEIRSALKKARDLKRLAQVRISATSAKLSGKSA